MSKKPDLFERGRAAGAARLAETDRHYQREKNRPETGVIKRGNDAMKQREGNYSVIRHGDDNDPAKH